MASAAGRIIRVIAGVSLILIGFSMKTTPGYVLLIVGIAPLFAGVFDVCLFAPLFKAPFQGKAIRESISRPVIGQ